MMLRRHHKRNSAKEEVVEIQPKSQAQKQKTSKRKATPKTKVGEADASKD